MTLRPLVPSMIAAAAVLAILTPSPRGDAVAGVVPAHVADPDDAKIADKCAGSIFKAAGKLAANRLKSLEKCADGIFNCLQTKPAGDKRDACVTKAGAKCDAALAKGDADKDKVSAAFAKRCAALPNPDFLGETGLSFEDIKEFCDNRFSITVDDAASAAQCVALHHQCDAERMFMVQMPRVGEMLSLAGVKQPDCMFGVTNASDIGDLDTGKALAKCQKAVKKAGTTFVAKKLKALTGCVDTVFGCVQLKSDDFDACMTKADATCDKAFNTIAAAAATLPQAVNAKCSAIAAAALSDNGMALANDGFGSKSCVSHGVADVTTLAEYETCLFRFHECTVEELVEFENPRAGEMLDLVGRKLFSDFCPGT